MVTIGDSFATRIHLEDAVLEVLVEPNWDGQNSVALMLPSHGKVVRGPIDDTEGT